MEELLAYEHDLFTWINSTHTPLTDALLWPFSGTLIWCPVVLVPFWFYLRKRPDRLPASLSIGLIILLCSIVSDLVFKPLFSRFRPTMHPLYLEQVRLLKEYAANGLYGFISGHTTNAFGFAMLSSLLIGKRPYTIGIFVWALAMGYSRIYLGAHFVSDVWAGMITGSLLGVLVFFLYRWATQRYFISHTPTEG